MAKHLGRKQDALNNRNRRRAALRIGNSNPFNTET